MARRVVVAFAIAIGVVGGSTGVASAAQPTIPPVTMTHGVVTDSLYVQRPFIARLPLLSSDNTNLIIDIVAGVICQRYFPAAVESCTPVLAYLGQHGLIATLAQARERDACVRIRFNAGTVMRGVVWPTVETNPQYCLRYVYGAIGERWMSLGGSSGPLGYALTDELGTPNKPGRYNHFRHGSIYWSASTGAWEVHGAIRDKWASLGWENSFLGFPRTNETPTPRRYGRFNHFQGGSVYWSPATGAHEVHGAIRDLWARMGWENSILGFPTSDEYAIAGGRRSRFETRQHYPTAGYYTIYGIDWTPSRGAWAWSMRLPYL